MDTNEIMVNEEVMEVTEEIATAGLGKDFKVAVGIGLAILVGGITYKYIAKPIMAKIKAKKNQQEIDTEMDDLEDAESVEEFDENE